MFDTKIAIILRDDLAVWQALNVTAFLTSGITAQYPDIIGQSYEDRDGHRYNPLSGQPIIILSAPASLMKTMHARILERRITVSLYIEEMFSTGHDAANRAVFSQSGQRDAKVVGVALRAERKVVDKVTKGARLHS